jgi:hypothetical protein
VTFHFLDNVFLLYFPLKTTECIFEGLSLLQSDFSQTNYTPLLALTGPFSYGKHRVSKSSGMWKDSRPSQNKNFSPSCTRRGAYALVAFRKLVGF